MTTISCFSKNIYFHDSYAGKNFYPGNCKMNICTTCSLVKAIFFSLTLSGICHVGLKYKYM